VTRQVAAERVKVQIEAPTFNLVAFPGIGTAEADEAKTEE
jgi:hypothetical protein